MPSNDPKPTTDDIFEKTPGIQDTTGLCVSGGGYRATLFHLGSLLRLNETGQLRQLARVSSVSGGSITAALLGLRWKSLEWDDAGVATNLEKQVVEPVRELTRKTIDRGAVIGGFLSPFESAGDKIRRAYDKVLFDGATLKDLPDSDAGDGPRFIINATNLQSGALWRFSRPYMGDYKVGLVKDPQVRLAVAVAASSAFPPVLSPVELDVSGCEFAKHATKRFLEGKFRETVILGDGGIYDNMGMETVWKRCRTVLVSDAGAAFSEETSVAADWARHAIRVLGVVDNQVRSLRKREIISDFLSTTGHKGAYWAIHQLPQVFKPTPGATPEDVARAAAVSGAISALGVDPERAGELARTPTRLKATDDAWQERLINLGYALCAVALGTHCAGPIPNAPVAWPYERGV